MLDWLRLPSARTTLIISGVAVVALPALLPFVGKAQGRTLIYLVVGISLLNGVAFLAQRWESARTAEQARERARIRLVLTPQEHLCGAKADVEPVLAAWRDTEERTCLAPLHRERPSLAQHAAMLGFGGSAHTVLNLRTGPLQSGVSLPDLLSLEGREDGGETLSDYEQAALQEARQRIQRSTQPLSSQMLLAQNALPSMRDYGAEPDKRTPAQYRKQIEKHLDISTRLLRQRLLQVEVHAEQARLVLRVHNPTDRNFTNVQIQVALPQGVGVLLGPMHVNPTPQRPRPFGARQPHLGYDSPPGTPYIHEHVPANTITLEPFNMRPDEILALPNMGLIINRPAGTTLILNWSATATDADGTASGSLNITVTSPADAHELLSKALTVNP